MNARGGRAEPIGTGRYAPSPTGDLHLGNLRTALRIRADGGVQTVHDLDQVVRGDDLLAQEGLGASQVLRLLAYTLGLAAAGEPVTPSLLLDRFDPTALPRQPWRLGAGDATPVSSTGASG